MARTLRLNVLGRFEARWSDGAPVDFNSKKIQAFLAYLAAESGRAHTRDHLATLLWSDTGDERARHNVRQALSKIRRCCDSLVASRGESLELNQAACTVDVIEFERLAKSSDPADLRRCLDLYRGDLLDGLSPREPAYDEWLLIARGRLRKVACETCDRMIDSLIVQSKIDEAIGALNHRLLMDPACEPAHAKLMELLARVGRRSDALRQYQSCVEVLKRELGAEPSPETKSLYERLRKADPGGGVETTPQLSVTLASAGRSQPTVAVLPFDNLSGPNDAYFVDGVVEDIITALSCFRSLLVIARGSSFVYRDRKVPDRQIAEELGAQFLVRGSVQRAGQRVRINVQLLDALAGLNLWAHRFERELADVFLLQDEITSTLASSLAGQVEAARLARARKAPPERLDAYDSVLRGKDHHHRFTPEDCRTCIEMFERAIEQDPSYAVAYAWLACGLGQAMVFKLDDPPKLVDRCLAIAGRGLELDENESECHRILAQVFLARRDLKRSLWHQERALFLNPNDDRSVCSMGEILSFIGKHEEAEGWVRKSMQLNPYHPQRYWTHLARPLFHLNRYQEALSALEHIGRLRADDHVYRLAASARLGGSETVARNAAEMREALPDIDPVSTARSLPYEHERDRQAVLEGLETAEKLLAKQ